MYGNNTKHTQILKIIKENIFPHTFCVLKNCWKTFSSDLRKPCLITGESLSPPTKIDVVHEKITYYINQLGITLCPSTEPIGEVLNKYTDTLCNVQKKTSLENSLLQHIPILNGNDSSQLEDWLADIETASELMGESRTKLVQASRGIVRTLISEPLTLHKTWEEIKDSLHLKICNSDIHTSISCFMDIQQKEKESLAAYIHHFKREANKCKFDNDVTTIRIFIKWLKMHTP